ncbi:hypothetical protein [Polynucleobacter arcticus]|uniref:Uncharacterized protein n=1 Tax=Polynucleobacter arcticus TaxID=1743165 RepID=A0A6M9PJX2_9BURK|nr:hypothetical protein [Polynucleobacter arcticus]QKM60711.1 hypothetical protein DN92_06510 [Polynucleobacter arcticus]
MTQVANEVKGFKSEVLTNGGSIQRVQDREAKNERERLEKEAYEKHAAEVAARRSKEREERAIKLLEKAKTQKLADEEAAKKTAAQRLLRDQEAEIQNAKKQTQNQAQKADRKSPATNLLDDLSKDSKPSISLLQISEDLEEGEELCESEDVKEEPIFTPVKGEVYVPTFIPVLESNAEPQAHDLGELMPAPVALTVDALPLPAIQVETAQEFINRMINLGLGDSSPDTNGEEKEAALENIKSKRGRERIQKIINEKRDLEKQVEDLQVTVVSLQETIRKFEIESNLVGNVMTLSNAKKNPSELVSEAKLQMINFLNTRSDEIDHIDKAVCFNKYMSDPFYMQVFVQNNQPEQWQTMIESIYEAIERPEPSFANVKPIAHHRPQPIRARTSTLGAPVASSGNPMDRIAQHLGNMGI